jgi:hypothetical protein
VANVLTGEAPADDINGNSVSLQSIGGEGSNIVIARNIRPMLRQHAPAERVNLAERDGLESACAFKPKREAADAAE